MYYELCEARNRIHDGAIRETEAILEAHWPAVAAIEDALLERKRIGYLTARKIIEAALEPDGIPGPSAQPPALPIPSATISLSQRASAGPPSPQLSGGRLRSIFRRQQRGEASCSLAKLRISSGDASRLRRSPAPRATTPTALSGWSAIRGMQTIGTSRANACFTVLSPHCVTSAAARGSTALCGTKSSKRAFEEHQTPCRRGWGLTILLEHLDIFPRDTPALSTWSAFMRAGANARRDRNEEAQAV